ncbi:MAG: putative membrane protein [uncultured archaeon A07HR67]|nr:MAG: putative membrane protein [uncultured archaeon A07HR67]
MSLDALRGVAVLGILVINVRVFSMPETTLLNPTVYGDFSGVNYWAWLVGHLFAELKFITVFSALFGAGIVLFIESKKRKDQPALRLHYRRTAWLILIGLGHAYLLWYGDILVAYGVCGLALVFVHDWEPRAQAGLGLLFLLVTPALEVFAGLTVGGEAIAPQWAPAEATLRAEVATYRGGWIEQLDHRVPTAIGRQTTGFLGGTFWRVGGTVLLGMALYKWGVLTGERSTRLYRRLAAGGVVGVATVLAGVWYIEANEWSAGAALFWRQFNYVGSLLVAGGYVGLVTLYARRRPDGPVTRAFAAVGRTAFTNYLLQTVVATTVFYGHGLGLFGAVSRAEALGMVVAFWAIEILVSVVWLRRFRFGPVEWVWRTLTYGERQPI